MSSKSRRFIASWLMMRELRNRIWLSLVSLVERLGLLISAFLTLCCSTVCALADLGISSMMLLSKGISLQSSSSMTSKGPTLSMKNITIAFWNPSNPSRLTRLFLSESLREQAPSQISTTPSGLVTRPCSKLRINWILLQRDSWRFGWFCRGGSISRNGFRMRRSREWRRSSARQWPTPSSKWRRRFQDTN